MPGFGVRVTARGSRSYIIQYRTETGRQRRMVIGDFPTLTVEQARELARIELAKVSQGDDPSADRRATRSARTLAYYARYYCEEYAQSVNLATGTVSAANYVLQRFAVPMMGPRKMSEISVNDIRRAFGHARVNGTLHQANRLLAVLSKIFNLAIEDEELEFNPCRTLKKYPEDQRWRHFSDDEVSRLLGACDRYEDQNAANAVRLLLLTGARKMEVLSAEWTQFDLEQGIWTKPSANTKTKRMHRLELAGPQLTLLKAMRDQDPTGRYLFPGRDGPFDPKHPKADRRQPRKHLRRAWEWLTREAGLEDAKLHDLRRTTASFMLDEGASLSTIGKALGHTQISTTNRYAQLRSTAQREGLEKIGNRMLALNPPVGKGTMAGESLH